MSYAGQKNKQKYRLVVSQWDKSSGRLLIPQTKLTISCGPIQGNMPRVTNPFPSCAQPGKKKKKKKKAANHQGPSCPLHDISATTVG